MTMAETAQANPAPVETPPAPEPEEKPMWASKTLWASVVVAVAPFVPVVGPFIAANPEAASAVVAVVFAALRLFSDSKVSVKKWKP
jgi:hypothetical protein